MCLCLCCLSGEGIAREATELDWLDDCTHRVQPQPAAHLAHPSRRCCRCPLRRPHTPTPTHPPRLPVARCSEPDRGRGWTPPAWVPVLGVLHLSWACLGHLSLCHGNAGILPRSWLRGSSFRPRLPMAFISQPAGFVELRQTLAKAHSVVHAAAFT